MLALEGPIWPFADERTSVTPRELREPLPTCREVVELITDYIEDRLAARDRERFERHLAVCQSCATYLHQIRLTISASASTPTDDAIAPEQRDELVAAFRALFRNR